VPKSVFFRLETFFRRKGANSIRKAAYRSGEALRDERSGKLFNYGGKRDVVLTGIASPVPLPFKDRQALWNANEVASLRWDARLSRDFIYAVPNELPDCAQEELVRWMAWWMANKFSLIVDFALHRPSPINPHGHLHCPPRTITANGFGKVCEAFANNYKSKAHVRRCRYKWARLCNVMLKRHGSKETVDPRSLAEQGSDMEPHRHEGSAVTALRRRKIETSVSRDNDGRMARNALRLTIARLTAELGRLRAQLAKAIGAWIDDRLSGPRPAPGKIDAPDEPASPREENIEPNIAPPAVEAEAAVEEEVPGPTRPVLPGLEIPVLSPFRRRPRR
jgi:hypothetical protein